jgi:hypothetical protein
VIEPATATLLTAAGCALASGLAAAEMLAARRVYTDRHLLGWGISRTTTKWSARGVRGHVLGAVLPWPRYG